MRRADAVDKLDIYARSMGTDSPRTLSAFRGPIGVEMEAVEPQGLDGAAVLTEPVHSPATISRIHDLQQVTKRLGRSVVSIQSPLGMTVGQLCVCRADRSVGLSNGAQGSNARDQGNQ